MAMVAEKKERVIKYYDPSPLLSYNRVIHMCIGERSIGKSYAFKRYVMNQWLKKKKKFILVRRYKTELKKVKKFFDDVAQEFPEYKWTVKGWNFYCDGELMGEALPLSAWQSTKSTSYPDYDTIIFDEFIKEKDMSTYIPDEVDAFMNLMYTVFRRRKGVRAFLLANSVTEANPYFLEFDIDYQDKRFNFSHSDVFKPFVVVENTQGLYTPSYEDLSDFEKMISHMEVGKMALKNEMKEDTSTFLEKRSKQSKFQFTVVFDGVQYGIWSDKEQGKLFMCRDVDPNTKRVYPMTVDDHGENLSYKNRWKDDYYLSKLVSAFKKGYIRFENQGVKKAGYDMFKKLRIF